MVDIKYEMRSERAKKTFQKLAKRVKDLIPIWKQFKDYYQNDIMPRVFASKGNIMEGSRWAALTPEYFKWKRSSKNPGRKELLRLSDTLFNAAQGGAGWFDKIDKKFMIMGVQGKDYFYYIQHRSKNPRYYFHTKNNDLPNRAWAYLIKITDEYLVESDK